MLTSWFDYPLPQEAIAQEPLAVRSDSKLLIVDRKTQDIRHAMFSDFAGLVEIGDVVVINDTRVSAFRLRGRRPSGAVVEALFVDRLDDVNFRALMKPGRRLHAGDEVIFGGDLRARIVERSEDGSRIVQMLSADGDAGSVDEQIVRIAETPLPPYIRKPLTTSERYQTVYSACPGSSAAPTAGLHFTDDVLRQVRQRGASIATITLHVGASTFRPLRTEHIEDHSLSPERVSVSEEAARTVNQAQGRVIAVGTTSVRTLEASADETGQIRSWTGETSLFIKPGHDFRVVSGLLTNFHMPRSTLLVLVCAFAGRDLVMEAYRQALDRGYRFLSLGDAMLVL